jgi:NAD(P)-dependent dehydrogenase (short-subunit alcohol dehydrogenase family)
MGIFGSPRKRSNGAAAVITGAGSGIGAAFATELARQGGRVVCSDIDETTARTTADGIVAAGGEAFATRCDVAQLDDVIQLAKVSQDWLGGPPTVVINNAGVGAGGTAIGETEIDDWNWVLGINLWGPIHGCHVFAPILREAGYGGIINVASAAAFAAAPGMAAYNVSKAGVLSLSETLSAELSGTGVNVTALCPTFVKTNIVDSGRITGKSTELGDRLMRWTGFSPDRVARTCLDTLDRGGLYCMPQPDARIGWGIKRFTPTVYTRAAGLSTRFAVN